MPSELQLPDQEVRRADASRMYRISAARVAMPAPRVLQALSLLFLCVSVSLPHCNATISSNSTNVSTRRGAAMTAATARWWTALIGVYPRVVLLNSGIEYHCEVMDGRQLEGFDLRVLPDKDFSFFRGWKATLLNGKNMVTFVPGSWSTTGLIQIALGRAWPFVSLFTTKLETYFMLPGDTETTFTAHNPYYGMQLQVTTNLPNVYAASGYLLVGSSANCQRITTCNAAEGCYDVTNVMRLPPPGSYHLCVTANDWGNRYLPWGQRTLEVKALISLPLTFVARTVPSVNIHDAVSGDTVNSVASKRYIVMCRSGTCPSVASQKGERMVDADVCYKSGFADRVYLTDTQSIVIPGTYALCVEDASGLFSPAAIPVTVVPKPFAMRVADVSKEFARVQVSGGDIESRQEKYAVCVALYGARCSSVTLAGNECTWSTQANADFVDVAMSEAISIDSMTFCLVTTIATFNGKDYLHIPVEGKYEPSTSEPTTIIPIIEKKLWIPILIGVACTLLLIGVIVIIVCCWRRRKGRTDKNSFPVDDGRAETVSESRQFTKEERRRLGHQSTEGDYIGGVNAPYANSSDYSLCEERSERFEVENSDVGH